MRPPRSMRSRLGVLLQALGGAGGQVCAPQMRYRAVNVDGVDIFYRETGPVDAPPILLLAGFPGGEIGMLVMETVVRIRREHANGKAIQ